MTPGATALANPKAGRNMAFVQMGFGAPALLPAQMSGTWGEVGGMWGDAMVMDEEVGMGLCGGGRGCCDVRGCVALLEDGVVLAVVRLGVAGLAGLGGAAGQLLRPGWL